MPTYTLTLNVVIIHICGKITPKLEIPPIFPNPVAYYNECMRMEYITHSYH